MLIPPSEEGHLVLATSELPPAPQLALVPRQAPSLALEADEPLTSGVPRVAIEQLDWMLYLLDSEPDRDLAIHEARKAAKRTRGTLRLVRGALGYFRYRQENVVLRDVARRLSPVRSSAVMVETVDELHASGSDPLSASSRDRLRSSLEERHERLAREVLDDRQLMIDTKVTLLTTRARFRTWPIDEAGATPGGPRPFRDVFATIAPGLQLTYARGRGAMRGAMTERNTHRLHVWRKRAKYLHYQLQVLADVDPEVFGRLAKDYGKLGSVLGTEHDYAELGELIATEPALIPNPLERRRYRTALHAQRRELQTKAIELGSGLFGDETFEFAARLRTCWEATRS